MDSETKKCNVCQEVKLKSIYFKSRHLSCKDCLNKKRNKKRLEKNGYRHINSNLVDSQTKMCKYCKNVHPVDNFRKNRLKCKDCEKQNGREYRKSNVGKLKSKQWLADNSDKMKSLQRDWHQNNKRHVNLRNQQRLEKDPILKLLKNYRRRLNMIIKKNARTLKYIDCSQEFLHEYITYYLKYMDSLTIDNYGGTWHIDHVIPIATFDLNVKENMWCLKWYNLAPLASERNLSKNKSIDKTQLQNHLCILKKFINEKK